MPKSKKKAATINKKIIESSLAIHHCLRDANDIRIWRLIELLKKCDKLEEAEWNNMFRDEG